MRKNKIFNMVQNLTKAATCSVGEENKQLNEKYYIANAMLEEHTDLIKEMESMGAVSLQDYIERFPHEAYLNGIIELKEYTFGKKFTEAEAEHIMRKYIQRINAEKEDISEDIKHLGGDIDKVQRIFDKIQFEL